MRGIPKAGAAAPAQNYADGGMVDDERPPTAAGRAAQPGFGFGASAPRGMPLTRPAPAAPVAAPAAPAAAPTPSVLDTDPQARSDRAAMGGAWDKAVDVSDDAGRAIADVAMLVPRGLVGAYDSTVVRGMRAAGLPADYLSPSLVPDGVDPLSMTPYTDAKRLQQQQAASGPAPAGSGPAQIPAGNSRAGAGRGFINPARVKPASEPAADAAPAVTSAAAAQPEVRQVAQGIYRSGNSYGDSPEVATSGARPAPQPSAQSQAAAEALSNRYAQEAALLTAAPRGLPGATGINAGGQNNRERARLVSALTTAMPGAQNGQLTASQRQGLSNLLDGERRDETSNRQAELQARTQTDIATMREAGDTGRLLMRESGENSRAGARNAIDSRRVEAEVRNAERTNKLYEQYDAAETPEQRAAIAQRIRDLSGKASNPKDDLLVVGGGQEWDADAGVMRNVPQRIYDARSRQYVDGTPQQAKPQAAPQDASKRVVGTVYIAPNGQPVQWTGKGWLPA